MNDDRIVSVQTPHVQGRSMAADDSELAQQTLDEAQIRVAREDDGQKGGVGHGRGFPFTDRKNQAQGTWNPDNWAGVLPYRPAPEEGGGCPGSQ